MSALPVPRSEAEGAGPAVFRGHAPRVQRAALQVSSPHDAAEAEARSAARHVMRQPAAPLLQREAVSLARSPRSLQREGGTVPAVSPDTAARLQSGAGRGQPLSPPLRRFMEPRFNADFSAVRLHTDGEAAALSRRLNARAFTHGGDVYFGRGEFRPESAEGRELIAHELAHTVQQGAAPRSTVQRSEAPALTPQPRGALHRLGLSDILDGLAALAAHLPGFTLLTLVIGRNPINQRAVERSPVNILRAFMGLIPGGELLFQVLQRQGVVDRLGAWIGDQVAALGLGFQAVRDAFVRFTDSLSWTDIFSPGDVWRRAEGVFRPIVDRVARLAGGLVTQAVTWLKETFLRPLADFCRQVPGYGLVTVMLGRDPFTNEAVPRSALNVVRAFAEFIPGGTEKVDQLVQSGALERAHAWLQQETAARNLTWARVAGTFQSAWASLRLQDVLAPVATVQRIGRQFSSLFVDLVSFAGAALVKLLELIYEAAMGAGGRRILEILMRARATFLVVIRNPVGFLRNLLGAVGQGVRQFMGNILAHLREGVIGWLTGAIARSGLQMPERWDLRGIIFFVLQILGLTWARVREKLVRLLGERVVAGLETGFQLLQEIRERGLVAALRDRVTEFFGSLRDAALGSIRSFIQERIVVAGITQLLSMLIPVAAILQAIQKTYTTIQFFIQRIQQILDLVESIVNSIAAIASGAIGAAANLVERTMARTLPVILDFLARFIGLGDVGAQVQRTIRQLQAAVDRMLDRAVEWIRTMAQRVGSAVVSGARRVAAAASQWWRNRREFRTRDGHSHSLSFRGERGAARLWFASEPLPIETYLAGKRTAAAGNADLLRPINEAQALLTRLAPITRATVETGAESAAIVALLDELSLKLIEIEGAGGPQPTRFDFAVPAGGQIAVTLLTRANAVGGSTPSASPRWYQFLQRHGLTENTAPDKWVRMHLLSEQVGGSGADERNLIAAPNSVNRGPRVGSFERAVYQLARPSPTATTSPSVVWVEVQASGPRPADPDIAGYTTSWFYSSVTMKAGLHLAVNGTWRKDPTPRVVENAIPIPPPDFAFGPPRLSAPSQTRLQRLDAGLFTSTVVDYMKAAARAATITSWPQFAAAVRQAVPPDSWDRRWKAGVDDSILDRIQAHVTARNVAI